MKTYHIPKSKSAEQADARVKELEECACNAEELRQVRADNAALRAANTELTAVVRAAYLHAIGKLDERAQKNLGAALARLGAKGSRTQALSSPASGEPHKPMMRDDPRYKGTSYGEPAKHPDTEGSK